MSLYYVEKLHITDKIYAVNLRAIIAKLRVYVLGKEGIILVHFCPDCDEHHQIY